MAAGRPLQLLVRGLHPEPERRVNDHQAEAAVLGACMLSGDAVTAARRILTSQDFHRGDHGTVYDAIVRLADQGLTPDPVLVYDELDKCGRGDTLGGAAGLMALLAATPTAARAGHYADIVRRHADRRRLNDLKRRIGAADNLDVIRQLIDTAPIAPNGTAATLSTRRLSDVPPEPLEPLFGGRLLVGKLSVIAGPGGIGKSYATMAVAAPLTWGGTLPGDPHGSPPGDVLIASYEDDAADTLRPRAEKLGAELERVHVIDGVPGPDGKVLPFGPDDIPRLAATLDTLPNPRMVVIDPVGAWVGAGVDIHRENEVRAALEGLRTLCAQRRIIGWLVMHLRKTVADNALSRILGAAAFGNTVRSVMLAGLQPGCASAEEGAAVAHIKHNLTPRAATLGYRISGSGFEWTGELDGLDGETLAGHIRRSDQDDEDQSKLAEATDWLRDVLTDVAEAGMERSEVIKLGKVEGHTERTLERAREDLNVDRQRDDTQRGRPSVWRLPDYLPSTLGSKPLAVNPQGADQQKHPDREGFLPNTHVGRKPNQDGPYDPGEPL